MKRHFQAAFIALVTLMSCGCSQSDIPENSQTETVAETETMAVSETQTSAVTESQADSYIDDDGFITDHGKERISEICAEYPDSYTGLFDFDRDGIPELYLVPSPDGNTIPQCSIYDIASGESIGNFTGYPQNGTTFFSYGNDCAYVHTFCEIPNISRYEEVTKLTFNDGKLSASPYLKLSGEADKNGFMKYSYFKDNELSDKETYDARMLNIYTRDEISVCNLDVSDINADTVSIYNDYISEKNTFGYTEDSDSSFFIYRDFDGDGTYEAFAQNGPDNHAVYFVKDKKSVMIHENYPVLQVYMIDDLCIMQMLTNGMPCIIYGVSDGEPYESELSGIGIYPERWEHKTGVLTVTNSAYDTTGTLDNRYAYGAHSFKPYWFYGEYDETENRTVYHEYGGSPITRDELENIDGYAEIFKEIDSIEGSIIKEIYRRGNGIVNINYMSPEGVPDVYTNHFVTILANEDLTRPTVISERTKVIDKEYDEFGIYLTALNDEIAVYPE